MFLFPRQNPELFAPGNPMASAGWSEDTSFTTPANKNKKEKKQLTPEEKTVATAKSSLGAVNTKIVETKGWKSKLEVPHV